MADRTQISASVNNEIIKWINEEPERKLISFSQMVEILLKEAKQEREKSDKKK